MVHPLGWFTEELHHGECQKYHFQAPRYKFWGGEDDPTPLYKLVLAPLVTVQTTYLPRPHLKKGSAVPVNSYPAASATVAF